MLIYRHKKNRHEAYKAASVGTFATQIIVFNVTDSKAHHMNQLLVLPCQRPFQLRQQRLLKTFLVHSRTSYLIRNTPNLQLLRV